MSRFSATASPGGRATLLAVGYSILGVLPLFLVSAQAVQLQRDLDFGRARLGLAVSLCFAVSALSAAPLGRLVHRIGAARGLKLSAGGAFAALVWMAAVAAEWWHLAVALAFCGLANAGAQVSTNVVLARGVRPGRQGVAFGAKQAAIPIASLTAGATLPVVALVAGWRWAFAAAAVVGLGALVLRTRLDDGDADETTSRAPRPTALLLSTALAGLLAGAVGNALPAFAVDAAVDHGFSVAAAGVLMAAGSAAAIIVRVGAGWVADRRGSAGFTELLGLTSAGALSLLALSLAGSDATYALATVAAFAAGWGWPGLIYYAIVRRHRGAPGAATGFVLSWVYVGNVAGPAIVGFIAAHRSYADAWAYTAVMLGLASAAVALARQLERAQARAQLRRPVGS